MLKIFSTGDIISLSKLTKEGEGMNIGERIRNRREELGLTQEELAKKLGYKSRSSVNKVETSRELSNKKVRLYADALDTTPAYLMGWTSEEKDKIVSNIFPITTHKLPILGEISCGEPRYTNEDRESYVDAGTDVKADFCLKAKGDSMINARIHDGDIVFIRKQDIVENGEIAAVVVNNESEATLKRFYYYQERATLILKPENPVYEDLIFQNEELNEVHVLGKAVAFQSDVK